MNKNIALLMGVAGLTGCVGQGSTTQKQEILPQKGIVTDAESFRTCDNPERVYYFEIDTDATRKGPEYAAVVHYACGKENVAIAQKEFPKGAVVDLKKSAPIISRLVKLGEREDKISVVFQKACMERE